MKDNVNDIYFTDAVDTAGDWVPRLIQDERADIVIALTHIGHYPMARHGSNAPGMSPWQRKLMAWTLLWRAYPGQTAAPGYQEQHLYPAGLRMG